MNLCLYQIKQAKLFLLQKINLFAHGFAFLGDEKNLENIEKSRKIVYNIHP